MISSRIHILEHVFAIHDRLYCFQLLVGEKKFLTVGEIDGLTYLQNLLIGQIDEAEVG